ncbi:MAG TPA: hypothetical protein VMI34_19600 [Candidatus Bathyarchaeia archaeon]|nr:hypothetical protein [Candidatus Bathyarchaeia archaeon]
MLRRGACSFALALAVAGCATVTTDRESAPGPDVSRSLPPGQGSLTAQRGRPGYVIGAPHGTTDTATDVIGLDLARRTGFGAAVGRGFGKLDAEGRRYNVNRPTEGVAGAPPRSELETPEARRVYEAYNRTVAEASQGPLRLYVEIHGNVHEDTAGRVEIATVGLDKEDAWQVKTLLELIRDSYLRGHPETPRLEIFVEPVDTLRYSASASKSGGMLGRSERSLHVELPKVARTTARDAYTAMLGDFLAQWADLLATARGK